MASTCISSLVDDARVPVRATYINLYKWPESDAEFVRSMSSNGRQDSFPQGHHRPRVVDSISCRQIYLRSYTFSRKETMNERTKKCLGRVRERVVVCGGGKKMTASPPLSSGGSRRRSGDGGRRKCTAIRKAKEASCAALASIFRRLLSCTTKVDVVD